MEKLHMIDFFFRKYSAPCFVTFLLAWRNFMLLTLCHPRDMGLWYTHLFLFAEPISDRAATRLFGTHFFRCRCVVETVVAVLNLLLLACADRLVAVLLLF